MLLLAGCFIIGMVFPKNIKETFFGGGATFSVPFSNMSNLPGGMNKNIGDFTDFLKSRHEKTTADEYTISEDHINQTNVLSGFQTKINKGLEKLATEGFGRTEKKPKPGMMWTESGPGQVGARTAAGTRERKSKNYPCHTNHATLHGYTCNVDQRDARAAAAQASSTAVS